MSLPSQAHDNVVNFSCFMISTLSHLAAFLVLISCAMASRMRVLIFSHAKEWTHFSLKYF
jgi:hypothetical protein